MLKNIKFLWTELYRGTHLSQKINDSKGLPSLFTYTTHALYNIKMQRQFLKTKTRSHVNLKREDSGKCSEKQPGRWCIYREESGYCLNG